MYQLTHLEKVILVFLEFALVGGYIWLIVAEVKTIFRVKRLEQYLQTNIPYIEKMLEDLQKSVNG